MGVRFPSLQLLGYRCCWRHSCLPSRLGEFETRIPHVPYKNPEDQKQYRRAYYQRTRQQAIQYSIDFIRRRRIKNRKYVADLKSSTPCVDCGVQYPHYVMQFDHLNAADKSDNVSTLASQGVSLDTLKLEIAKCEIVCANCHAARTYTRL